MAHRVADWLIEEQKRRVAAAVEGRKPPVRSDEGKEVRLKRSAAKPEKPKKVPPAVAPQVPAIVTETNWEPNMEELLASFRRILAEDGSEERSSAPQETEESAVVVDIGSGAEPVIPDDEDILELVDVIPEKFGWLEWIMRGELPSKPAVTVSVNGKMIEVTPVWLRACFDSFARKYHCSAVAMVEVAYVHRMFQSFGIDQYFHFNPFSATDEVCQTLGMTLGQIIMKRRENKRIANNAYISGLLDAALFGSPRAVLYSAILERLNHELSIRHIAPDVIHDHFIVFCDFPDFPIDRMSESLAEYARRILFGIPTSDDIERAKRFWDLVIRSDHRLESLAQKSMDHAKRALPKDEYDLRQEFFDHIL